MADDSTRRWTKPVSLEAGIAARQALRADIAKGMADLAADRVGDFDMDRIVERGRVLLAERRGFDA